MNKLIYISINSFRNKKTYNNFLLINICFIAFLLLIAIVDTYLELKVNNAMNEIGNREFIVYETLEIIPYEVDSVYYDIFAVEIINSKEYRLISDDFNNNISSIKVNEKEKKNFINYATKIDIIEDENVGNETIYINQLVASKIIKNIERNKYNNISITIQLKNYNDVKKFKNYLESNNINYNTNKDDTLNINNIKDLQRLIRLFAFIIMIVIFLILIIFYLNYANEEKKTIAIYKVIGLSKHQVIIVNLATLLFYIIIISVILLTLLVVILSLIRFLYHMNLFKNTYQIIFTILTYCLISSLVVRIALIQKR